MKRLILALALIVGAASSASAQSTISSYVLRSYAVGATSPISTFTFQATAVVCGQAQPVVSPTVNPTKVVWNDPTNTTQACIWIDPGTGPLFSLPLGNYEATLSAVNSVGASAESARSPFSKEAVPATVTGLRLYK